MEDASRLKHLRKNLSFLQKTHPLMACRITMTRPEGVEFCNTEQGELNLVRHYEGNQYYYHNPLGALKEAQEWFKSLDLHTATVIFIYGIGLGYYYEAAQEWLKKHPHHHLIFLEKDPAVLHRLCETQLGGILLRDPQVTISLFEDPIEDKALFNELSWSYYEHSFVIASLRLYEEADPTGFLSLHHQLSYTIQEKRDFVLEYLHCGVVFFRNFYPNLLELPHSFWGNGLFQCFSQVPAIICGAGPSLSKHLEDLKQVAQQALIFSGGSALSSLLPNGIVPHFGVAIDPNNEQYSRVAAAEAFRIPFFYRNRLFHEALKAIKGHRLYLTGSGGYDTATWFERELNVEGEDLDEGHNVVNFSLQIAAALGCNPIILVGVDLALTDQRFYAEGITTHLNLVEEDLIKQASDSLPISATDIYGKPVHTFWKWIAEAKWISQFATQHAEINIINATEGGIGFEGIPNIPLKEVIQRYLGEPRPAINQIEAIIQNNSLSHITREKVMKLIQRMNESLDLCVIRLSKLIEECHCLEHTILSEGTFPEDLCTPRIALLEGELEEEIGYQYVLKMFHQVFIHIHHRALQDLKSTKRKMAKKKRAMDALAIQKEKWLYLRDVAQVNREIILHTLALAS